MTRWLLGFALSSSFLAGAAAAQDSPHRLFTQTGDTVHDHLGWSLDGVGDVDGDGCDDYVVGAIR